LARLRADVRSIASEALATVRELATSPGVPPAVRLRACLAILSAADAPKPEPIGPMTVGEVRAVLAQKQLIGSLFDS
jgi:hypothetical protein